MKICIILFAFHMVPNRLDKFRRIGYNAIKRKRIAFYFYHGKKYLIMDYVYQTEMVCAREIHFHLEDDVVTDVSFIGGCNGNLKAISKLIDGWSVSQIEEKLRGNTCGPRPTSCADQLAKAVRQAYDQSKA